MAKGRQAQYDLRSWFKTDNALRPPFPFAPAEQGQYFKPALFIGYRHMNDISPQDFSKFIYFHPHTRGENGRKVYIDPAQLLPFLDLVDTSQKAGISLARAIVDKLKGIKSQAGNLQAESNIQKAGVHRSNFGPVQVTYTIEQTKTNTNRGEGVYITRIASLDISRTGEPYIARPGFYLVAKEDDRWRMKHPITAINTLVGVIGAKIVENYFDGRFSIDFYGRKIHEAGANTEDMYSFLYTPSYILDSLGTWQTPEQKQLPSGSQQTKFARILHASVSQSNWDADYKEKHIWYVFDGGAKFLEEALVKYQALAAGKTLEKHEFRLVNPKTNMGTLLTELKKLKAKTEDKLHHLDAAPAKAHQIVNFDALPYGVISNPKTQTKLYELERKIKKYYPASDENICFSEIVAKILHDINSEWS